MRRLRICCGYFAVLLLVFPFNMVDSIVYAMEAYSKNACNNGRLRKKENINKLHPAQSMLILCKYACQSHTAWEYDNSSPRLKVGQYTD